MFQKIATAKWTLNPDRITNHDRSVQKNWDDFKNGKIPNLPKELVDHLNKFTNRALIFKPFEAPRSKVVVNVNKKPMSTEFSEIITSYNELKAKKCNGSNEESTVNIDSDTLKNMSSNDFKNINKKIKKEPVTLHELQSTLENRLNKGKALAEDEKLLLQNLKWAPREVDLTERRDTFEDVMKNKYESSQGATLMQKKQRDFNHLIYPEKIAIPKELRKKGYTYKLSDCYYDDDGQFLYRVPGME